MKRTGLIGLLAVLILAGVFYFGNHTSGKTTIGEDGYGFAQMRGTWDLFAGEVGMPSVTYLGESDSILEFGVFPFPKKPDDKSDKGSGIKTRGDVTEYVESFLKKLGKAENLRTSKGKFLHYEANVITAEYHDPFLDNRHFFVKAWVFTDEKGLNRFIILESDDNHFALDERDLSESFRL